MKSTEKQQIEIKNFIQTELLKRGFTAQIVHFAEVEGRRGNNSHFEFKTERFQTVPVLFKAIEVNNFNSSIMAEETDEENGYVYTPFWIQVHVSYEHFSGGSNGCSLFDVRGHLNPNGRVYELSAK